ncbi:GNAT family N-acetyltransferase [Neptunicella sp. SCSIO 80796]|uniref:GNAT family N-acetyltransferase n=1 Tax=Neptunicella plasticusilytica TaxID=3117012 RepID=UPI003A4E1061
MEICLAASRQQIQDCFAVMQHLRPQFEVDQFVEQVSQQMQQGYHLAFVSLNNQVVGAAGFVIGTKLAWGKHLYVDDLVTDPQVRSSGVGKALLDWLADFAMQHGCQQLHLDSGVQRFAAHKFYLREGMSIASHHFSKPL